MAAWWSCAAEIGDGVRVSEGSFQTKQRRRWATWTSPIARIARPGVSAAPIDPVPEPGDKIRVMVTESLRSSNSAGGGGGVFYIEQWRLQIVVVAAMSAALVDLLEFNLYTNGSCCYEVNLN
nr:hypothetical protein Iba_chr06cCG6510 [Ipomoea batatas]